MGSDDENFMMVDDAPTKLLVEDTLKKIRDTVKYFKKSPVKNDLLQKLIQDHHGKEYKLVLDCRTRWNSICPMVERYILLKDCIDIISPILISDDEIQVLKVILIINFFLKINQRM